MDTYINNYTTTHAQKHILIYIQKTWNTNTDSKENKNIVTKAHKSKNTQRLTHANTRKHTQSHTQTQTNT